MRKRLERVVGASSNFTNNDIMKEYICKHYGSLDKCAEELNVGRSTVYRWVQSNPRGILLHAPEIIRDKKGASAPSLPTRTRKAVNTTADRRGRTTTASRRGTLGRSGGG